MSSSKKTFWTETLPDPLPANPLETAAEWLAAAQREARQIDETLFFETCGVPTASETRAAIRRRR